MAVPETGRVRAEAKWVRTSPRKARLVAEHIRGRSVPEARTVLAFTPRAAAREVEKVLRSAIANAEANHGLIGDELYVRAATVDEGPTLKRWRARARGRVGRIRKRTCHITVLLEPIPEEAFPQPRAEQPRAERRKAEQPKAEQPKTEEPKAEQPTPEEPVVEETADEAPAAEKPKRTRVPRRKKTEGSETS